jgi:hypothetical protein
MVHVAQIPSLSAFGQQSAPHAQLIEENNLVVSFGVSLGPAQAINDERAEKTRA